MNTRCLLKFESFEAIYNKGQRFLSQLETGLIQSLSKPWEFALGNTEIVSTVGRKWSLSTVLFCCIDDKILQYQNYSWVVKLVWSKLSSQCCLVALGKIYRYYFLYSLTSFYMSKQISKFRAFSSFNMEGFFVW